MSGGSPFENPKNATYEYFYCSHAQETGHVVQDTITNHVLKNPASLGTRGSVSPSVCFFHV